MTEDLSQVNSNSPAPFIDPSLQRQLNLITGETIDGRPKVRLVWGQSPDATVFYRGENRMRYLLKTTKFLRGWDARYYTESGGLKEIKRLPPSTSPPKAPGALFITPVYEHQDVGIPRWFLEQYLPPSLSIIGWEEARYDTNSETGEIIDELGPPPTNGMYESAFLMLAQHDGCCNESFKPGCLGSYRSPEPYDLEYVRWIMFKLNEEPYKYSWEQMPPPEVVAQAIKDAKYEAEQLQLKEGEELSYAIKNSLLTSRRRLEGDGHGLDRFTYHDLGAAFAKARKF